MYTAYPWLRRKAGKGGQSSLTGESVLSVKTFMLCATHIAASVVEKGPARISNGLESLAGPFTIFYKNKFSK
jgi:hypothetical protein